MSAIDVPSPSFTDLQNALVERLAHFRQKLRRHLVLEGAARWLAELIGVLLLSFILDRLLRLSVPTRMALVMLGAAFLFYEAWRFILLPWRLEMSLIGLAAAIDRAARNQPEGTRPVLAARVASVLELPALLDGPTAPSAVMVRAAVLRCHDALDAIDFESHLNRDRRRGSTAIIIGLLLIPLVLTACSPASAALWFKRYFLASNIPWPQKTYLMVQGIEGGSLVVPRAEPFVLRVLTQSGSVDPQTVTLRYREDKGPRSTVAMSRFGPGDWRYEFPPLGAAAQVEISGNDDTQEFSILPVDRPRITELLLISQHPTEPKPTSHNVAGLDADLSFLPKTKLELQFTSNAPVDEVKLKSNVAPPGMADLKRIDEHKFSLSWTHEAAVQLQIELVGTGAKLTSVPTPVAIGLKQDLPPRVSLTFSGVRQRISPMATIPLVIQARDDFGVARLDLTTKSQVLVPESTTEPSAATQPSGQSVTTTLVGPVIPPTDLEVQFAHRLSVPDLHLTAGSMLSITAAGVDNCYLGPQTGLSRTLTFRVVPGEELFREILLRQQAERVKFRKQIEAAQKLKDQIAALSTPDAISDAARDHRTIQRETLRIGNSLSESITEMKLNQLGGREAWDLMDNKVLAPLKKLNDELMNQQKDALDALRPGAAENIAAAVKREDQVIATMQEILKQMSQWDSFVDVVNQLNEIIKLETNVHQSTDQLKKKQTEGVFQD